MAKRRLWLGVPLVTLGALALAGYAAGGQQPKSGGSGPKQEGRQNTSTPEGAYNAAREAVQKGDYQAFANLLTEDSQEAFAGMMVMAGAMFRSLADSPPIKGLDEETNRKLKEKFEAMAKPFNRVLAEHQVGAETLEETAKKVEKLWGQKPKAEEVKKAMMAAAAPVKDKARFVAAVMKALRQEIGGAFWEPLELKDLQVQGATATAKVLNKGGTTQPIGFKKTAQGWRIEIPDEAYAELIRGPSPFPR